MPTALIVEDEPEANKLLAMLVQLRGYRTDSAYTGGEALAMIDSRLPDIVFLDLMLPDVNGYEVCKALKSSKTTAMIPVVMVTARVAVENRIQSYCVGADLYVPKPYTPDQIYQAMADADDWLRQVARNESEGLIRFDSLDEGESLRHLAQLRSLMIALTPLEIDVACRANEALRQLWTLADSWGRRHGILAVATLTYRLLPDRVELTLTDLAGWFRNDPLSPAERWQTEIACGGFESVEVGPSGDRVTFTLRFPSETRPDVERS